MPSPIQTSQAATVITIKARICPSPFPHMRANATSERLAPFSIGSRHSNTTSGLRRVITPTTPSEKTIAETARYQAMLTEGPPVGSAIAANKPSPVLPSDTLGRRACALGADQVEGHELALLLILQAAPPSGEHDGAHGRDQQQKRGRLER